MYRQVEIGSYDCGRLVPQGEVIRQNEGTGNVGGIGYGHRSGWGGVSGSWKSQGKSYWLFIPRDRKRVENRRFWQMVMIGIVLGFIINCNYCLSNC